MKILPYVVIVQWGAGRAYIASTHPDELHGMLGKRQAQVKANKLFELNKRKGGAPIAHLRGPIIDKGLT